ncbi:hypothetical protein L873DRAFT_1807605 [Choiromyces venosus 120613-1]|uniref:Large ribosomal subunit protein mL49 n=1 Tax=Choiromyces venosus 120613-1 TaxID=1336337 RepID=A0A3N4JPI2_9PEZI|nr:hypothetical protein L873DRAFT_1807605 [Choiromyces venosus 120613-1]
MLPASTPLRLFRTIPVVFHRTASFTTGAFRREGVPSPVNRTFEPLPYFVSRTENNNLPVYQEYKAGGNKLQTRIRRIEGNLSFLKKQIEEAFQMEKGHVTINYRVGHVIVKGRRRDEVVRFLLDLRF